MTHAELNERLRRLGIQTKDFALLLGVAGSTVSRWGTEAGFPVPKWVIVLLKLLDEEGSRLPLNQMELIASNQMAMMEALATVLADGVTTADRQIWVNALRASIQRTAIALAGSTEPIR